MTSECWRRTISTPTDRIVHEGDPHISKGGEAVREYGELVKEGMGIYKDHINEACAVATLFLKWSPPQDHVIARENAPE